MNVNDLLCVGATPVTFVDYVAVEDAKPDLIDQISIGLAEGARQAGVSIVGGEIAQLKDMIKGDPQAPGYGFDIAGTAVGTVPLNQVIVGQNLEPGDVVIGLKSSGIHSNGLSLARKVLFEDAGLDAYTMVPELERGLGEELLEPTLIYVPEVLAVLRSGIPVKALAHITGDGLLNVGRVRTEVGFVIDNLPEPSGIFSVIQRLGGLPDATMYSVFNMGIGFTLTVPELYADQTIAILQAQGRRALRIGYVSDRDPDRRIRLPHLHLVSAGKTFVEG